MPDDPGRDAALVERAAEVADELLDDALSGATRAERRRQLRLGRIVEDAAARELVQRLTDEVLRHRDVHGAAQRFAGIVADHGVPPALGPVDRALLAAGARLAPRLARLVMPLVRRRIVAETRGLVIPADDPGLARHVVARSRAGVALNVNLLGEAILSDVEARQRLDRVLALIGRPDVDYVSVKISALCAQLDVVAFEHSVSRICTALREVFAAAESSTPRVFVNLDMEEYADVELTLAAFTRTLDETSLRNVTAGIVVQAYLPDAHDVLERLGSWARRRVDSGGAPIKVRIVKGANLAMELVDAELHGWVPAPYATKADTDASAKALLDSALRPAWTGAVRVGLGSHNLFDVAWGLEQRALLAPGERGRLELEMLEGMVPAQARAVQARAGELLLYCPIVRDDELDASLAYLARRFDENTAPENFLRAMFGMQRGSTTWRAEADRFRASVAARATVSRAPRRPGIADDVAEALAAGRFANEPDTDFTSAAARDAVWTAMAGPPAMDEFPFVDSLDGIDAVVARALAAAVGWRSRPASTRAATLREAGDVIAAERNTAIAVMADETGKTVREGDPEAGEAADFARFVATAELPAEAAPVGVVVVAAPWNFPYAIPAGGVFAALMAGNAVILKPAPEARRTAWLLVQQCWRAGVPRDVLQFVACPDDEVGRRLITHPGVGTVILTGAHDTARLFLDWQPRVRLLAETSGKDAMVVTGAADIDLAVRDVVRSAFGHAGQKCSAASLLILTPEASDGPLLERLAAAVRTLRPGWPQDPATTMGPLIAPPGEALRRGLTELDSGESWLVEPRQLDDAGRLWSPGIRLGVRDGSWFHRTECFGPVLGVMHAVDLDHAIELQNGTPFGLTGGIHSLDEHEVDRWLRRVEVGNAYVNRHITGAIVRRQPFGGWKRSSVGGGPKSGGPNYVAAFTRPAAASIVVGAARSSYQRAWATTFAIDHDPSALRSESNVLRYHPLRHVAVRVGDDTPAGALDAARAAAEVCGVRLTVLDGDELPDGRLDRLRVLTSAAGESLLRAAHAADVAVDDTPMSADGRFELVHWVREQSVSVTRHRAGRLTAHRPLPAVR